MSPSTKTVLLTFRVPPDVMAWVDEDIERQGKACRADWMNDLLTALKDGRVTVRPKIPQVGGRRPFGPAPKL